VVKSDRVGRRLLRSRKTWCLLDNIFTQTGLKSSKFFCGSMRQNAGMRSFVIAGDDGVLS